ncbi:MAG: PAS domain S-box protein, partial [Rhodospirillaceae bacterium]|nr:PAS domain S-box protein [Rhodospirillaceae bacterium]
ADGEPVERLFHDGRSIEIRHMRLPDGGYVLTYTNMTERRLAEQELRKLFRAVEQSPTGIVIFNSEYVIEYANPKFTDITGYSSTEVIGQTTTDLFARLYQLGRPEGLTDALENGLDWSGEYIGQRRDGDYFWLRDTMAPIFGDDEALTHWISISEDITDLKSVQSDLVHASKLTTLGEMAASLTHELNQPLNVIRMAADSCLILAEDGDTNPEFMIEQFDTISEQTQRMAEIIRHMRIFSRKDEDETAEVRLIEVIENGVRLIKDEFRLANIDLRVDIPERCPPVRGYPVRVEQILVNLLTNARDAIVANAAPGQGANEKIGWVEIAMAYLEDVNSVIVLVRDSGGGIPDQALPKIFESFYTTKPSGKGTGLGLSVAQSIIREMGGQISVTNIDDGAEFRITLPALRKARTKRGGKP